MSSPRQSGGHRVMEGGPVAMGGDAVKGSRLADPAW